jgi:hypothetical protein
MMSRIHAAAIAALLLAPTIHLAAEDAEPVDPTDEELATPAPEKKSEPTPPTKPAPRVTPAVAGALPPPAELGRTRTVVTGCMAKGQKSSADTRASRSSSADGDEEVEVTKTPGGAIVTHHLSHNCCLKAQVSAKIEQEHVIVLEKLVGKPCRCRCKSTLKTAVGLAPGWWTVDVDVDVGGKVERVTAQMVSVPEAHPGTAR